VNQSIQDRGECYICTQSSVANYLQYATHITEDISRIHTNCPVFDPGGGSYRCLKSNLVSKLGSILLLKKIHHVCNVIYKGIISGHVVNIFRNVILVSYSFGSGTYCCKEEDNMNRFSYIKDALFLEIGFLALCFDVRNTQSHFALVSVLNLPQPHIFNKALYMVGTIPKQTKGGLHNSHRSGCMWIHYNVVVLVS